MGLLFGVEVSTSSLAAFSKVTEFVDVETVLASGQILDVGVDDSLAITDLDESDDTRDTGVKIGVKDTDSVFDISLHERRGFM